MAWWQTLLFPFAIIYDLVTRLRNHLYDIKSKPSIRFEANVISVGNLAVGGTGKSPMLTYLVDYFLSQGKQIATLSRGYGRKTSGFIAAASDDNAKTIGDESAGLLEKYGDKVLVTVGEERAMAIPQILTIDPETDVILLDDAYQHRKVTPSYSILLTTYDRPFYEDHLMPSGRLRESANGAERADVVVVTKCPAEVEERTRLGMKERIRQYNKSASVHFTSVVYGDLVSLHQNGSKLKDKVVAVAGLASNQPFFDEVERKYELIQTFDFNDHHHYSDKQIGELVEVLEREGASLVTTHKDAVKLREFDQFKDHSCFYLPIEVDFLSDESEFLKGLEASIKKYSIHPTNH